MKVTRSHNMTSADAVSWVDAKIGEMLGEFEGSVSGLKREWKGTTLHFEFRVARIAKFRGQLAVTDDELKLDLPFPLLARGKEREARNEVNSWLDRNLQTR